MSNVKKRHHYVPKAYLRAFCGDRGKLWVFPKDSRREAFFASPDNVTNETYYYSQPTPEGGVDHNRLEDFFSELETIWPPILKRWTAYQPANDMLDPLFQFLGMMRVRVPATRDAAEAFLAYMVKNQIEKLKEEGTLPTPPVGFETLLSDIEISIDPHRSIHAMVPFLNGLGKIFGNIGLEVIHNDTDILFITSDNPVMHFDPEITESKMLPYQVTPKYPRIELLFPISPKMMLRGHSDLKRLFDHDGITHRRSSNREEIKRCNRMTARFGYRFLIASDRDSEALIKKHAGKSPIPQFQTINTTAGRSVKFEMTFGNIPYKPKWKRRT